MFLLLAYARWPFRPSGALMDSGPVPLPTMKKGTPMYEMRAESTVDRGELVWHVIAKDVPASTLCGSRLAPPLAAPHGEATAERYCGLCMTAFGSAIQSGTR